MNNYNEMNNFLQMIKNYYLQNPQLLDKKNFVYSMLISFNINNNPLENITNITDQVELDYKNNKNIYARYESIAPGFLWFSNGEIRGNEIKLYIPLDYDHIYKGSRLLFDFIASTNIEHQSKIANSIRNDNIVLRVNSLEDADTIIDFVNKNNYIKEGLLKTNPFLPNCNGVGITMDNTFSFNTVISETISEYIKLMINKNRLDLINVDGLNSYLSFKKENLLKQSNLSKTKKLDLYDIYDLLCKTTSKNYSLKDFVNHANNKLIDRYNEKRERITDPSYYFEIAVIRTNEKYPQNTRSAIKNYLKGNSNYFTNDNRAREGLIKYVNPGDIINIMRTKLTENRINIPNSDLELINEYLNIIITKKLDLQKQFDIIKTAYINTMSIPRYGKIQADGALKKLIEFNDISSFTNQFGDRDKLTKINCDLKKVVLSGIDISNINLNNIDEIIERFFSLVVQPVNVNQY